MAKAKTITVKGGKIDLKSNNASSGVKNRKTGEITYTLKDKPAEENVQALADRLSGVAMVAKDKGIDTSKADAMVAQTKAEGKKEFKGSSYDTGFEPTTISDTNVREKYIPEIDSKINKYAETGQYYDANGNLHNADGTISESNTTQEGGAYSTGSAEADGLMTSANQDSKLIFDTLDTLMKQTDADTASQIQSIKAQYNIREKQLEEVNRREQLGEATSLLLGGSSRYAGSASGIMAGYQRADIMELAELDAKEMSAISEAKAAQATKNYNLASKKLDYVETLRKEKVEKATEIAKNIAEENKKMREKIAKQTTEYAIADLFKQGITDATEILDLINYTEDGKPTGGYITLKEIEDTLKIINPDANLTGASTDYKTYKMMQKAGEIPDNWNFFDYKTAVTNAGKSGSGGYTATEQRKLEQAGLNNASRQEQLDYLYGDSANEELTDEDKRTLRGAGMTAEEIADIPKSVNEFGIDAVLKELDGRKASAVKSVFNVQEQVTRDSIESTVTKKTAQEGLQSTYTDAELSELARANGYSMWFTGDEGEVEEFLNSDKAKELYVDLLEKQYRDAGMLSE